jgi:hypothetical protein
MTPLDDELRAALQGRASALAPSADPLAGIERRAKRIRRNRVGAAVAASALAVSAIAVAVPALQSATSSGPDLPRVGTAPASLEPTATTSPYALDPANPWTYRGDDLELLGPGTLNEIERQFGIRHGTNDVALTPLSGQVWEPSQKFELFFLADVAGELRWGISETPNDAGPEFLLDEPLAEPVIALAAALGGDEVGRLYVVAAPGTALEYAPDGEAFAAMTALEDGVGVEPLEGDPATDRYRVLDPSGEEITSGPAPDAAAEEQPTGEAAVFLDPWEPWEVRGDRSLVTDGQLEALGEDWASRNGIDAEVETVPLYVQRYETDAGIEVVYLVRSGDGPWTWGVASLGEGGWAVYAEHEITEPLPALAAALPDVDGRERLLVVAAPSTGGALYAEDGEDYRPMTDLAAGVFLIGTPAGDGDDTYKVLDGDGDLDNPVVEASAPDFQNAR